MYMEKGNNLGREGGMGKVIKKGQPTFSSSSSSSSFKKSVRYWVGGVFWAGGGAEMAIFDSIILR